MALDFLPQPGDNGQPVTQASIAGKQAIGQEQVRKAEEIRKKYKEGKANLETKIVENQQWYQARHWEVMDKNHDRRQNQIEPKSGWLFNAIANKHADAMDNFPSANVLAREQGDEAEAKMLSSILPVVLDQTNFEDVYDREANYKLVTGTGVFGVFWDGSRHNGLGDVSIKQVDLVNLFWEPGVEDIQDSRNFFSVELMDNDILYDQYPQLHGKLGPNTVDIAQYVHDDAIDTSEKSAVVDWYYKKNVDGRTILHYCKYCNDEVLFATENDPKYQNGWYDHGMYPFFFDPMFRLPGTPCGFGYIDIGKNEQEYIDRGGKAIMQNVLANARPRHFIRSDGSVNEAEYADMEKDFVHVDGNLGQDSIMPIPVNPLSALYVNVIDEKVNELKEVTGNRDISNGGTTSGVTAASAIAAMQEAGSKLSRDNNKASFRVFKQICLMVIELIRQFYDVPRMFRIMGEQGAYEYMMFSNAGMLPQEQGAEMGIDMGVRVPEFDVNVVPQKASPYSKMAQNELALQFYSAGFFNPMMAQQALACLQIMDFDGKDKLIRTIQQNQMALMMGDPMAAAGMMGMPGQPSGEPKEGESSITANARQRVADSTAPR